MHKCYMLHILSQLEQATVRFPFGRKRKEKGTGKKYITLYEEERDNSFIFTEKNNNGEHIIKSIRGINIGEKHE